MLKNTMIDLIRDIKYVYPEKHLDLLFMELYFNKKDPKYLYDQFILYVHPYKQMIEEENKDFFCKNNYIFMGLPPNKVDEYITLFRTLSIENEKSVWKYFKLMMIYSELIIE